MNRYYGTMLRKNKHWYNDRNQQIRIDYQLGKTLEELSYKYNLSVGWLAVLVDKEKHQRWKQKAEMLRQKKMGAKVKRLIARGNSPQVIMEQLNMCIEQFNYYCR
jgi:hypothetical protein